MSFQLRLAEERFQEAEARAKQLEKQVIWCRMINTYFHLTFVCII